jgi:hypothetical protein
VDQEDIQEPRLESDPGARERTSELLRQPRIRLGALVAVVLAAGVIAWVVIGSLSSNSTRTPNSPVAPVGLSASGLLTLARATAGQPIYWAGTRQGYLYELSRTSSGVFVRYLPPGVEVGAKGAKFLVIATYPFANAFETLQKVANGQEISLPGGGIAVVDKPYPKSVHLAYPGVDYQVEVYDPSPARSLQVARSGDVRPVVK